MVVLKCGWARANTFFSFSSHSSMWWNCFSLSLSSLVFVEMTELIRFNCGKHARFNHFFALYLSLLLIICHHAIRIRLSGFAIRMNRPKECNVNERNCSSDDDKVVLYDIAFLLRCILSFLFLIYCILVCTLHS